MRTDVWRDVEGFEGEYQVSDEGRVRSLDRIKVLSGGESRRLKGRLLRPGRSSSGYYSVSLSGVTHNVHVLVAAAFIGPRPPKADVMHKNHNKADNMAGNLSYGSRRDNMADMVAADRHQRGMRHCRAKLTDADVLEIRRRHEEGEQQKILAHEFKVHRNMVHYIVKRKNWKHV